MSVNLFCEYINQKKRRPNPTIRTDSLGLLGWIARNATGTTGPLRQAPDINTATTSLMRRRFLHSMIDVDPSNFRKMDTLLATWLGETKRINRDSTSGAVRQSLMNARRIGENLTKHYRRMVEGQAVESLISEYRRLAASKGINHTAQNALYQDLVNHAMIPELIGDYTDNPLVIQVYAHLYDKFVSELKTRGFDNVEIATLMDNATAYYRIEGDVQRVAIEQGVNIEDIKPDDWRNEELEKIKKEKETLKAQWAEMDATRKKEWKEQDSLKEPTQRRRDARLRLEEQLKARRQAQLEKLDKKIARVETEYKTRVRAHSNILPGIGYFPLIPTEKLEAILRRRPELSQFRSIDAEDVFVSVYNRTRGKASQNFIPNESLPAIRKILNDKLGTNYTLSDLTDMLFDDTVTWRKTLDKLGPDLLDKMINDGLLTQVPMMNRDVANYLTDTLELPFDSNELFKQDPLQALHTITDSWARAAGQSSMLDYAGSRGLREGWASHKPVEGWRKLKDEDWASVGIRHTASFPNAEMYFHPEVAQHIKALISMSRNPGVMTGFAKALQYLTRLGAVTALGGRAFKFVGTVALGDFLSNMHAMKFNPVAGITYPASVVDVYHTVFKGDFSYLDNEKPFVKVGDKSYTARDAMERLISFRGNELAAQLNNEGIKFKGDAKEWFINLASIATAVPDAIRIAKWSYGKENLDLIGVAWEGLRYWVKAGYAQTFEAWFTPFALASNYSNIVARWNILRNSSGAFDSWEDMFRYMDDYIFAADTGGYVQQKASLVMPFVRYAMAAPPAAFRHALRHPNQVLALGAAHRLYADALLSEDEENIEAYYKDASGGKFTVYVSRDKQGNPIAWYPTQVDQIIDGYQTFITGYHAITGQPMTSQDERDAAIQSSTRELLEGIASRTIFRSALEGIAGRDFFLDTNLDDIEDANLMGISIDPRLDKFLRVIPGIDMIDRALPEQIVGRPTRRDYLNRVYQQGYASWQGAKRGPQTTRDFENPVVNFLNRTFGLRFETIRRFENVQWNLKEYEQAIKDLTTSINRKNKLNKLEGVSNDKQVEDLVFKRLALQKDYELLKAYAKSEGIPLSDALQKLREVEYLVSPGVAPSVESSLKIMEEFLDGLDGTELAE